jgi:TetR/AcrR family transcriptional repressor of lmrAB and yxaGH operons
MESHARQQLIETTSRLLEAQGYHGTGLNQIVRESGAPRGSLYYYFPEGKEELAAEAIAGKGQSMAGFITVTLASRQDAIEAILACFDQMVDYTQGNHYCSGAPMAAVALETAATSERLRGACAAAYEELRGPFLRKLLDDGFAPERAESLSTTIVAALEGAVILSRTQQSTLPMEHLRVEMGELLRCARASRS